MEWFWTHPLGITITGGVVVGIVLTIVLGLPGKIGRWWQGRGRSPLVPQDDSHGQLQRRALDTMTYTVSSIEEVWRSASGWALRIKADKAAMEVEAMAYQLRDAEARRLILEWKAAYDSAPHGEGQGATDQATVMRDGYRAAAKRLGELIRGEK